MSLGSIRGRFVSAGLLALFLGSAARAQTPVIVVDVAHPPPSPGVDFAQISQAVAAAAGGEIILVHPGSYQPFTVSGKSFVIVAQGLVQVQGTVTVQALTANQSVVLRGLTGQGSATAPGLLIDGCAGPVWVESCEWSGGTGGADPDGVHVLDSLAVTLVRCVINGGQGVGGSQFTSPSGAPALHTEGSAVAAWSVTATGGDGWYGWDNGGSGGAGALIDGGSQVRAIGGSFIGGAGLGGESHYDALCGCEFCWPAGYGGTGLVASGTCTVQLSDAILRGGPGVDNPDSFCAGNDGYELSDFGHHVAQFGAPLDTLRLSSPVHEGDSLLLSLFGQHGDSVLVLASGQPAYLPLAYGTLSIAPALSFVVGALPPSGELVLPVHVPELGPGAEGLLLLAQPLFVSAGVKLLGTPSVTVLLDAQF